MAKAYRARCLVLDKTKLGETDSILTMLAEDGRQIRAVAKGLRRPGSRFGARLEPFSVVDVLLHPGRSLDVVGECRCEVTNAACREGLERPCACAVIAEFLEKLTRDGALSGERVFPLTCVAFAAIGQGMPQDAGLYVAAHLFKAMAMQGLRPAIHECALCGEPVERAERFDVSAGGALCASCARDSGTGSVDALLVSWVDVLLRSTFAELAEAQGAPVRPLLDLCDSWAREHLSVNLRSMPFLKTLY